MDLGDILKAMSDAGDLSTLKSVSGAQRGSGVNLPDINLDGSEEENKKTLMVVREIARAFAEKSNYYEASSLLEKVGDNEGEVDLSTTLAMGECYLTLGRESKAITCIEKVQKFLLSRPTLPASEVYETAESMIEAKLYLRALILLPVAAELYRRSPESDNAAEGMFRCIKKADDCTCPMLREGGRSRVLAIDFGLDFMKDCLKRLIALDNADPKKIAFKHGIVAGWISYIHWILDENMKGIKSRQAAIDHLEKAFGPSANQRRVYATLFYNIGVGYDILNKSSEAKAAYEKAIDAAEHATDFDDDAARQKEINSYRQKLRQLK